MELLKIQQYAVCESHKKYQATEKGKKEMKRFKNEKIMTGKCYPTSGLLYKALLGKTKVTTNYKMNNLPEI